MSEQLVHLDPAKVLADDNIRFNLKKTAIDTLATDILESNGVLVPVEVETLVPPQNGFTHKLTAGFIRHAAVMKLNAESKAGLTLPAIVRNTGDGLIRLRHQISENIARESMSPMDQAVAANKLLEAGVSRSEVRRVMARPGGKKGVTIEPLSNAMLNILLRFLELPKGIQEKIHDGRVGVAAAYELGKVPPEKRAQVLERAEKERDDQLARERKDEERWIAAEKKLADAQTQQAEALSKVDEAKAAITAAQETVKEKMQALKEVQKVDFLAMDDAGKKQTMERLKAAENDKKAALKLEKDAVNTLAKLTVVAKTAEETAKEQREKLDAARKAVKPAGKKANKAEVGPTDIQRAKKDEGVAGYVPLSLSDIRQCVKDVTADKDEVVSAIGKAFKDSFDGKTTPKLLVEELRVILGAVMQAARESMVKPAPAPGVQAPAGAVGRGQTAAAKKGNGKQATV